MNDLSAGASDLASPGPLEGVCVLDLGGSVAAAYCGTLLAACGADVAKVEPTGGGDVVRALPPLAESAQAPEASGMQAVLDAGKRSLALDLGQPAGADILRRLAGRAEVIVEGLPPGRLDALGLPDDAPEMADAIVVSLSWFGRTGPAAAWQGADAVVHALSGFLHPIGPAEGPPLIPGGFQTQINAGLPAFIAVMSALIGRLSGGGGVRIDQSILEAQAAYAEPSAVRFAHDGTFSSRKGVNIFQPVSPQTLYPAQEGWIGVTALTPAQWRALCELAGLPDLAGDPRFATAALRNQNHEALDAALAPSFLSRPALDWFHEGQRRRIPLAIVPTMADFPTLDHFRDREVFASYQHPEIGEFSAPAVPWKLSGSPLRRGGRAPRLGEHGREILAERLGLADPEIEALIRSGVVGAAEATA